MKAKGKPKKMPAMMGGKRGEAAMKGEMPPLMRKKKGKK